MSNTALRQQMRQSREPSQEMIRRLLAAERARVSTGRTRKSTFTAPGINSMESMLREF